jgi:hypothetical protein
MESSTKNAENPVEKSPQTPGTGRVSGPFPALTKLLCKAGKPLILLSL